MRRIALTLLTLALLVIPAVFVNTIIGYLPALFFIADWDEYVSTRRVYFDIRETPMLTAADQNGLEALIRGMTPEKARENCAAIRDTRPEGRRRRFSGRTGRGLPPPGA